MIKAVSVTKVYKSAQEDIYALKNINLEILPQDYVSIVGPSGAGKSTLLHLLGGLEIPSSGEILFNGENIYRMRDKKLSLWRCEKVGFVFQFYHLIEELNIMENITVASFCGKQSKKYSFKRAAELLKYLGIENKQEFFPSQLSGGERQKVAIARALINDPEIIFCDEPTGNLDKDSQIKVVSFLEKLNREMKKIIVLVTHNLELAKRTKRTLFIEEGTILAYK